MIKNSMRRTYFYGFLGKLGSAICSYIGANLSEEMVWVFYFLVISAGAQCWIFMDKSFWNAVWKDGLPVSPVSERKGCAIFYNSRNVCSESKVG